METTANRIEKVRRERGLTQTALAKMIQTRPATISDIEKGKRQVGRWLVPLAMSLGVTTDYLLGLESSLGPRGHVDGVSLDALPEERRQLISKLVEWLSESPA